MNDSPWIIGLATLAGALGIWRILPRANGRRGARNAGVLLLAVSLGLFACRSASGSSWVEHGIFLTLAAVVLVAAIAAVTLRDPTAGVVAFGVSVLGTVALLLLGGAQWPIVAAVLLWGGATLLTLLFVAMRVRTDGKVPCDRGSWEPLLSAATGAAVAGLIWLTVTDVLGEKNPKNALLQNDLAVAALLFGIGAIGLLSRRNMIVMLLASQVMLDGVLMSLAAFDRFHESLGGQTLAVVIIIAAAVQVAVAAVLVLPLCRPTAEPDVAACGALRESNLPSPNEEHASHVPHEPHEAARSYALAMVLGLLVLIGILLI